MAAHARAGIPLPPQARIAPVQTRTSALVVDDESPARDELAYLLHTFPGVSLVHAAGSSSEAIRHVQRHRYDLLFLDVRMPGLDGLQVAQILQQSAISPVIIFVTAYEEYAVRAFDVQARDYLLKPISRARVEKALQRALGPDRAHVRASTRGPAPALPVQVSGRTKMIECGQVAWVEAVGDYVRLQLTDGSAHLIRMPISRVEERWSPHGFVRIHRGYLVPIRAITEFAVRGRHHTVTVSGRALPVSRRHVRDVRERFLHAASSGPP